VVCFLGQVEGAGRGPAAGGCSCLTALGHALCMHACPMCCACRGAWGGCCQEVLGLDPCLCGFGTQACQLAVAHSWSVLYSRSSSSSSSRSPRR
jgi:hypothetical protein